MKTSRLAAVWRRLVAKRGSFAALMLILSCSSLSHAQNCPAGNPRVAPNARYVLVTPGTAAEPVVADVQTALVWKRCVQGRSGSDCSIGNAVAMNWGAALSAAEVESYAGFADWRLPNRNELRSLVETGCSFPALNTQLFPVWDNSPLWSSTTRASLAAFAWSVSFSDGVSESAMKSGDMLVRLVRGGGPLSEFDAGADFTPNSFSLATVVGVAASQLQSSNLVSVSGLSTPVGIGVSGVASSEYQINGEAFTASPGVVRSGDLVRVRHLSASGPMQTTITTLRIGAVTADFNTTTAGDSIFTDGFE